MSLSTTPFARRFINLLENTPASPGLFNPWVQPNDDDAAGQGPATRLERLTQHLSAPEIRWIAVGEAAGYQGARISGIPFTSEALLMDGAIPRLGHSGRLSSRPKPWSEPSARILWELLYRYDMAEDVVLWNACPFHPFGNGPYSNRTPTTGEVRLGLPLLRLLVDENPNARFLAIGNRSANALGSLGIPHTALRHPAYGGKAELDSQLRAVSITVSKVII